MKKRIIQFLGFIAIIAGGAVAALLVRGFLTGRIHDGWTIGASLLLVGFCMYLTHVGIRGISYGKQRVAGRAQFGWGRILLGFTIIFTELKNYFAPAPNLLKPDNEAQVAGMHAATYLICGIAIYLLVVGIRAGVTKNRIVVQSPTTTPAPRK